MVGKKHSICKRIYGLMVKQVTTAAKMEVRGSRQEEGCTSFVKGWRTISAGHSHRLVWSS